MPLRVFAMGQRLGTPNVWLSTQILPKFIYHRNAIRPRKIHFRLMRATKKSCSQYSFTGCISVPALLLQHLA